jgi:hypothetical protein
LERALEGVLGALTTDRTIGDWICRLCEVAACPQDRCPVEQHLTHQEPSWEQASRVEQRPWPAEEPGEEQSPCP